MIWLAWRQARAAGYGLLLVTVGFTGLALLERTQHMAGMSRSLSIYQSLLIGVLLGAPLIAPEFENGTYRLVWTQGVTRARWLAARCAVALTLALAGAAALHTVVIGVAEGGRPRLLAPPLDNLTTSGLVPYARAVWMVLLGLLAGALIRRTVGSVAVTAVGWMATQVLLDLGLPRWLPDGWRDDFWSVQLGAAALLVGLAAVALAGTLVALGMRPAVPRRRPGPVPVRVHGAGAH